MGEGQVAVPAAIRRPLRNPNVKFEEYLYYARIQREQERRGLDSREREEIYQGIAREAESPNGGSATVVGDEKANEKSATSVTIPPPGPAVTAGAWEFASRAVRNASWGSI